MGEILRGIKVLVVEDDHFVQLDLQYMLESAGATVVTAASVAEAVTALNDKYHAAILDVRLSDGEVRPVAEGLAARQTPIIFHSGTADTTDWVQGFPGALSVPKPVPEQLLLNIVRQHSVSVED